MPGILRFVNAISACGICEGEGANALYGSTLPTQQWKQDSSDQHRALQEEKGLADEETRERDALYERAERLVSALATIGDNLREIIDDVNAGVHVLCECAAALLIHLAHCQHSESLCAALRIGHFAESFSTADRCCSYHRRSIHPSWQGSAHPQQSAAGPDIR